MDNNYCVPVCVSEELSQAAPVGLLVPPNLARGSFFSLEAGRN